jgi:cytochrome c-type biogenesis protein CcsB
MALPGLTETATGLFGDYLNKLRNARISGDYGDADKALQALKENQAKYGAAVYPSQLKTKLEIFYINSAIYSKLALVYVILGFGMLVFQFVTLFTEQKSPEFLFRSGFLVVLAAFVVHTAGLAIRWYISGHAPWSNGYETLLYISWATILAGLAFANRSPMTLAVTAVLSAVSLFVAGMSWMNPELTNLVPVLKSYWLVIHVAVVTASYGFFGVAALLGLVNLLLMVLAPFGGNREKFRFTIRELALVIELAIIPGLFMLTAGSFLGGIWANESWGRYWGWDPKETWALVTILVYAFIAHMHRIPGFRGSFAMSLGSVTGFGSVLMTYFGVNYYLQGLHSYAGGETVPVPAGIYVAVFLVISLALSAYFSEKHHFGKEEMPHPPSG